MKALVFALGIGVAMGQGPNVSTVFQFHHIEGAQALKEVATMVRTVAEVPQVSVDDVAKTVSLTGSEGSLQIAGWMLAELDRAPVTASVTPQFSVTNNDVVRLFYLANQPTVQTFQELATAVRTVVAIRRVFTLNRGRVLVLRGTPDEIAAAAWMIQQLDQPAAAQHTDADHTMVDPNNRGETQVRILYAPYAETVQQFQEAATAIRTVAEIRRVFTYANLRAIPVRGTAEQIALAAWLVKELGKPGDEAAYSYPDDSRDHATAVRVFYVKNAPTQQAFQQVATQIRTQTQIRRLFTYSGTNVLAARGTPAQVAAAEQMLKDRELAAK